MISYDVEDYDGIGMVMMVMVGICSEAMMILIMTMITTKAMRMMMRVAMIKTLHSKFLRPSCLSLLAPCALLASEHAPCSSSQLLVVLNSDADDDVSDDDDVVDDVGAFFLHQNNMCCAFV